MAREKEGYRDHLAFITSRFGEDKIALTVQETCQLLGIHPETMRYDKKFPKRKIGRRVIVPVVELARWMCG